VTCGSPLRLCGYDTDAALSKAFKREYSMTPGEYRVVAARWSTSVDQRRRGGQRC
jgi:AraC-like DNA-binding protein